MTTQRPAWTKEKAPWDIKVDVPFESKDEFKKIPGAHWSGSGGGWWIPAEATDNEQQEPATASLNEALLSRLAPHQQVGFQLALQDPTGFMLNWDTGLGKTYGALSIALAVRPSPHVLVVCPAGGKKVWEKLGRLWNFSTTCYWPGTKTKKKTTNWETNENAQPTGTLTIINYENIDKLTEEQKVGFDVLIADECFEGNTLVHTPTGLRKIKDLEVGDEIYGVHSDGVISVEKVVVTNNHIAENPIDVVVNGERFETTTNHPFLTADGWQKAEDINGKEVKAAYVVRNQRQDWGGSLQSEAFRSKERTSPHQFGLARASVQKQRSDGRPFESRRVYTLSVSGPMTFMVGEQGAVVHNCHYLCNTNNGKLAKAPKRTRLMFELRDLNPSAYRIALSATPAADHPVDLWGQLEWLHPGRWGSYWKFVAYFHELTNDALGHPVIGNVRHVEEFRKRFKAVAHSVRKDEIKMVPTEVRVHRNEEWTVDPSTIVMCDTHKEVERLAHLHPDALSFHGGTSVKRRLALIEQAELERRPIITTMHCVKEAIDLTHWNRTIYPEASYQILPLLQSMGRTHRMNSTKPVSYEFHVRGPFEEKKIERVVSKIKDIQALIPAGMDLSEYLAKHYGQNELDQELAMLENEIGSLEWEEME